MKYSINDQSKTIHAQFTGAVDVDSLIHHILTLRSGQFFHDGFNLIVDCTKASLPKGYIEIAKIAEFVKTTSVVRETFKVAILVKTAEQLRSANLYALLVKQSYILVCDSRKVAEDWVTNSPKAKSHQRPEASNEDIRKPGQHCTVKPPVIL